MDVQSDQSEGGLGDDDSLYLRGNVRIKQGSLEIQAATATVERRGGDIARIVLEGSPVRMDQMTDRGEPVTATAARIVYTPTDEVILLSGAARVEQPRGTMTSETIRYNMTSGTVNSGGDGNRVRMVIQPKAPAAAN